MLLPLFLPAAAISPIVDQINPTVDQKETNYGDYANLVRFYEKHSKEASKALSKHDEIFVFFALADLNDDGFLDGYELMYAMQGFNRNEEKQSMTAVEQAALDAMVEHTLSEVFCSKIGRYRWKW
jgi:Ca2+-binding EF-hand superfamily protein